MEKEYLGDSVYAEFDGYHVVLTTNNGLGATNTILLDPDVLRSLFHYADELHRRLVAAQRDKQPFKESIE